MEDFHYSFIWLQKNFFPVKKKKEKMINMNKIIKKKNKKIPIKLEVKKNNTV